MPNVLVVGATRGLGAEIAQHYARNEFSVTGTARSHSPPKGLHHDISWITGIDIAEPNASSRLVSGLKGHKQDIVVVTAGFFPSESFEELDWEAELKTYKICAMGPLFVVQGLARAGLLRKTDGGEGGAGAKVVLVSSEAGSIGLRHESEGGAMYAHHGSKAALNMVGKLLGMNLKDDGVAVAMVHPGFMRTEMTKGVGFDKFWDDGGAVTPDVAAKSLVEWIDGFDISKTGEFWAPRGPGDIGTAEDTMGPKDKLSTPLQLPW